ncbi:MAG TPA: hypothetical protein VLM83_05465 [Anaerolineales bacterium]|nr:hypothetical protein [Anaerolineales bacterium]
MKRPLFPIIIMLSMILTLAAPTPSVQANPLLSLPDLDQDGMSTTMENAGWYNLAGGPYITNPNEADTDFDGLTDSEEKLFDTDPTDLMSPGISVKYDSSFKTFEYYNTSDPAYLAMKQGGSQYLLTEGAVIRRGTTFKIAAVNSLTASLTILGPDGMTVLTPVRDPARGGWNVTVPTGGTVGSYTATITNGAWSKSMGIYVIFELPTDLTPAEIEAYLYDDDPANLRDEVSVWWRAVDWQYYNDDSVTFTPCLESDPICSEWQYHTVSGFAQAFWTEQFTKKVLLEFTLPVMAGKTSPYAAAEAIIVKADQSVRVNFASVKNSFSSATAYQYFPDDPSHRDTPYRMDGGACETSAGVLTSMLRSAGIPSRSFALDYNKTAGHGEGGSFGDFEYDHAVMMWMKDVSDANNLWYADRSFQGAEDEWQSAPIWESGTTGLRPLAEIGLYDPDNPTLQFNKFQDYYSDAVQSANAGWDFQNGSDGGGMVNTAWTGIDVPEEEFINYVQNRDFKWNSKKPLQIQQSPYVDIFNCQLWMGDNWAPSEWMNPPISLPEGRDEARTYYLPLGIPTDITDIENWPYNPQPTSCTASTSADACAVFMAAWQAACTALPGQALARSPSPAIQPAQPAASSLNTTVHLGNILSDAGLDHNGDGRFDQLVVRFEITSSQVGEYQLGGWLRAGNKQIRSDTSRVALTAGTQTVQITFDGQQIGDNEINGPYQVEVLWVSPANQAVSEMALIEEMTAYQTYAYNTQPYLASTFTIRAASVSGSYSYDSTDTNGNGQIDTITISVPLNIAIPGTFMVEADLYDGRGAFVGHAEWTGNSPTASLQYAVAGTVPPYSLEHLNLRDASGKQLSAFYAPVYQITNLNGSVDPLNTGLSSSPLGLTPLSITLPDTFTVTPVDSNANGRYDQLVVTTTVDITVAGSYRMEGLLVDEHNLPAAWSVSDPQMLSVGLDQTIQMAFDGRILFDKTPLVGSEQFTLVAVKIYAGSLDLATLVADIPVSGLTTSDYSRSQLEPSTNATNLFQDDMEAGLVKWTLDGSSQWSQPTTDWHSFTHTWKADGTNRDGLLSLAAPLNLTNFANPWFMFATAYQVSDGQSITLEVSIDGTHWNVLKTYTGSTAYWTVEVIDLSAYAQNTSVSVRFNVPTNSGSIWYVDDVYAYVENSYSIFLPLVSR